MYHKKARQLKNGLWHYTCASNHDIYPIGYCSLFKTCSKCEGKSDGCGGDCKYGVVKNESPCPGHKTGEEACEHYREYLLDKAHTLTCEHSMLCKICGAETKVLMACDESYYALCIEHCNREGLNALLEVYESWGS